MTPYCSGTSFDSKPYHQLSPSDGDNLCLSYQSKVGSLNWLAHTKRPYLSTVVSLLAQHQSNPSHGHFDVALYVARYLATTKTLGIYFTSTCHFTLKSFLHFLLPQSLLFYGRCQLGPAGYTQMKLSTELPLFTSCYMPTFSIDLFGPLFWLSKGQSIYATDECVKVLLQLVQILMQTGQSAVLQKAFAIFKCKRTKLRKAFLRPLFKYFMFMVTYTWLIFSQRR